MKQNIFDDEQFFSAYMKYRHSPNCINTVIEQPALRQQIGDLADARVLDIGCGAGNFCRYALEKGAAFVLGLDISRRMCAQAESDLGRNPNVRIVNQAIEDFNWQGQPFDIITSSLTMHYVDPLAEVLKRTASWLRNNGMFLMSVNHPLYTAKLGAPLNPSDSNVVRNYWSEGIRKHTWFVEGVIKYHRTLQTYVHMLSLAGLRLTTLDELSPGSAGISEWDGNPSLVEGPIFILFNAEKSQC